MPSSTYLPSREADLALWANQFEAFISANAALIGLLPAQVTAFTSLNSAWTLALAAVAAPATRTPGAVTAKNAAKAELIEGTNGIRQLVNIIQAFPGTTDTMRTDMGITVRDEPTPIPAPTVSPEIDFVPTATRMVRLRLHNEKTLSKRRPEGVTGAAVFYHVGATPPLEWKDWTFCENTSLTIVEVDLGVSVPSGSTVWFTAQWFNPRMESGPATTPTSTVVQWGGVSMAA